MNRRSYTRIDVQATTSAEIHVCATHILLYFPLMVGDVVAEHFVVKCWSLIVIQFAVVVFVSQLPQAQREYLKG